MSDNCSRNIRNICHLFPATCLHHKTNLKNFTRNFSQRMHDFCSIL